MYSYVIGSIDILLIFLFDCFNPLTFDFSDFFLFLYEIHSEPQHQPALSKAEDDLQGLNEQGKSKMFVN